MENLSVSYEASLTVLDSTKPPKTVRGKTPRSQMQNNDKSVFIGIFTEKLPLQEIKLNIKINKRSGTGKYNAVKMELKILFFPPIYLKRFVEKAPATTMKES